MSIDAAILGGVMDGNASLPQLLITIALLGIVVYALLMAIMKKTGAQEQRRDVERTREAVETLISKTDRTIELLESIDQKLGDGQNKQS
jgi:hypothetical protein